MKNLLLIFLLVAFVLPVVGQVDSVNIKKKDAFKNQLDLDVEFLGLSVGYKKRVYKNWFVGGRTGGGLSYVRIYFQSDYSEVTFETTHFQLFSQYSIQQKILIESGLRYSLLWDGDSSFNVVSGTLSIYFGLKKVQVGVRIGFSHIDEENAYLNSLLILKIPLKKW